MNSETYKYTAAKALPKTYQVGEKPMYSKAGTREETTTPLKQQQHQALLQHLMRMTT